MDQPPRTRQNAVEHTFGPTHFPQDIHVDGAFASRHIMGDARLRDSALNSVGQKFFMAIAAGAPLVRHGDQVSFSSYESAFTPEKVPTPPAAAQAPELSPLTRLFPCRPPPGGDLLARNDKWLQRLQDLSPGKRLHILFSI